MKMLRGFSSKIFVLFSRFVTSKNLNVNVRCLSDSAASEDFLKEKALSENKSLLAYKNPIIQEPI